MSWQLSLSPGKCAVLPIGRGSGFPFSVCGEPIPMAPDRIQRDLGVLITPNLSFAAHITHITSRASNACFLIKKSLTQPSPNILCRAFTTYVRPILEYASPVFHSFLTVPESTQVESVQRKFTKWLFKKCHLPDQGYDYRCQVLCLEPLHLRRRNNDLLMLHKVFLNCRHRVTRERQY